LFAIFRRKTALGMELAIYLIDTKFIGEEDDSQRNARREKWT
jgi:hypothetical protein